VSFLSISTLFAMKFCTRPCVRLRRLWKEIQQKELALSYQVYQPYPGADAVMHTHSLHAFRMSSNLFKNQSLTQHTWARSVWFGHWHRYTRDQWSRVGMFQQGPRRAQQNRACDLLHKCTKILNSGLLKVTVIFL
jgi:hypothetical protein